MQSTVKAVEDSSKALLREIIRCCRPGMVTVGTIASLLITLTEPLAWPQACKKLHSVTVIVYVPSVGNLAPATTVGGLNVNALLRNATTADPSPSLLCTVKTGAAQTRPPEPKEEDRSTVSALQPTTEAGIERDTVGGVAKSGVCTVTVVASEVGQLAQIDAN